MPDTPPVAGPGAFSQRTDTAPGQPVRVPTGQPYGKAKQLEQAQQAVPLPAQPGGVPPSAAPGAGPAPTAGPPQPGGQSPTLPMPPDILSTIAHPTQRPNEPVTAPSGNLTPNTIPVQSVLQTLEGLIARSDKVPDNVMRLYQNLRQEVASQGQ